MPRRCASGPAGRSSTARCATSRPVTKDGQRIDLHDECRPAGRPAAARRIRARDGIGLFRTELQFMIASTMPEARGAGGALSRRARRRRRAGRSPSARIDIGGDKVAALFRERDDEENPALGWRAIRLDLDRPGLLRTQIRALLQGRRRAASCASCCRWSPSLARSPGARDHRQKEVRHLSRFGHHLPTQLKLGAMLEVPSLLWQLDELMEDVDFVSVGSNDLFQFVMATDRGNTRVSDRFDPLSAAVPARAASRSREAGERNQTPVTLCGELAGKPISAMALIGLGYRSISMSAAAIGPVKAMLLGLDLQALSTVMEEALNDGHVRRPRCAISLCVSPKVTIFRFSV